MTTVGMPRALAMSNPAALARLLITAEMSQGNFASSKDRMLLPRPDIRMTIFFILKLLAVNQETCVCASLP
jgi:hypothetical protein